MRNEVQTAKHQSIRQPFIVYRLYLLCYWPEFEADKLLKEVRNALKIISVAPYNRYFKCEEGQTVEPAW
jgi:hypothetical protein